MAADGTGVDDLRRTVDQHPFWYHVLDLPGGVATPGWFDLRPVLDRIPIPDVRGKRCLDIGTYDGFFAFEMERRGAAEVVAVDIEDNMLWDWPIDARPQRREDLPGGSYDGARKGGGFRIAAAALGSNVKWLPLSVYDLDPATLGTFDVVVCGSLLLHLRDPVRAVEAIRSVCHGSFVSSEQIELWLSIIGWRRPLYKLRGMGEWCQWWLPNALGHYHLLAVGGFEIEEVSRPFVLRFAAHPLPERSWREQLDTLGRWALTGGREQGVLHRAIRARPKMFS
jgi:tRNA (mo5U34)-methyltransferase